MAMFLTHYLHPYSRFFPAKLSRAPHSGLTRKFRRRPIFARTLNAFPEFFSHSSATQGLPHKIYIFPALTLSVPSSFFVSFLGKSGDERSVTFSPGPLVWETVGGGIMGI